MLTDYRDFLRTRNLEEWGPDHPYAKRLRGLNRQPNAAYDTFRKGIERSDPEVSANVIAGLVKVTSYLLDQQVRRLEQDFIEEGSLRERMTRTRIERRNQQKRKSP